MQVTFRHGRLPNDPSKPRVRADEFITGAPPVLVDHYSAVPVWGMLGNDQWGDCTCAGDGHVACQQSRIGTGTEVVPTTAQALAVYSAISGFNPNAGPPGQNPTDNGATVQSALGYLRRHGMAGFSIAAFAEIGVKDTSKVKQAIAELGALSLGINLPASAMTQFNNGEPWQVVPGSQIDGGHCVIAVGYDPEWVYVVTWGQVQKMSWLFWDKYVEEAWVVLSKDWAGLANPDHVDLHGLGQEFAALTGEPNPFPAPAPPPPPPPPPAPQPKPARPGFWDWIQAFLGFLGL